MVVKMMRRWRPWPPLAARKYEARLVVERLEGCDPVAPAAEGGGMAVEVRWKGPKLALMVMRRNAVKRNFTREERVGEGGAVCWNEEFESVCTLSEYKENAFHPWEIAFTVFNGLNQGLKNKVPIVGVASLNLSEFASAAEQKEFELSIPLTLPGVSTDSPPLLSISLNLVELRTSQEAANPIERSIVPSQSPQQCGEAVSAEKDELSALKAGLKKVKLLTDYMSARRARKACLDEEGSDGKCSAKSEDGEYTYPLDSDSPDVSEEEESDEGKENSNIRKSFSYGTLAYANCAGGSFYSNARISGEIEDWIYYSHRKSDVGCSNNEDPFASVSEQSQPQGSKRRILSWRKRKLSFRSPKAKGEPLLKKAYAEEGGDDIDYDRRQLSSDESLSLGWSKTEEDSSANRSSMSEFGDDNFAVGSWERKEVISRDGLMKLQTQVFFASIDQRSERAAGESACTALVAVIADWFQANRDLMPIKSQFDSLIRDGSFEWRNLCDNEAYRERFPDKHFDLETVLQAKIRPLSVVPEKSFIGFFHPEGIMDEGRFDFLHGAMSFDNIWDEVSRAGSDGPNNGEPHLYIVSWNDHFFILKVEPEAYYIIDTLGERLYEGCSQAYILKFDRSTTIHKLLNTVQPPEDKTTDQNNQQTDQVNPKEEGPVAEGAVVPAPEEQTKTNEAEEIVCQGKESCKEYIKSFLAAIPLRELQADIKKGLASTPLHQRLQIEFHYTRFLQPMTMTTSSAEVAAPAAVLQAIEGATAEAACPGASCE